MQIKDCHGAPIEVPAEAISLAIQLLEGLTSIPGSSVIDAVILLRKGYWDETKPEESLYTLGLAQAKAIIDLVMRDNQIKKI